MSGDEIAAKVAAGRRKLEEYKSKKNPKREETDEDETECLKLQRQLKFHAQTVEFLVSERNALSARLTDAEAELRTLRANNEDLSARLNVSRHRASCLEMEHSKTRERLADAESGLTEAREEISALRAAGDSSDGRRDDLEERLREAASAVAAKVAENADLRRELQDCVLRLNAAELRLGRSDESDREELLRRLAEADGRLEESRAERSRSDAHYGQYVRQLNDQLESLGLKHEAVLSENENLINREANLMQQMDSLERQLQKMVPSELRTPPDVDPSDETRDENRRLKVILQEKEDLLNDAARQIDDLQDRIRDLTATVELLDAEKPDAAKLNAANESDRIAAQKATSQNNSLKLEVETLQEAYKKMTDSKLDLAEMLQAEKNLTKTLDIELANNQRQLKETLFKLNAKDEEMIRLQAESSRLERQALKHAQMADRLHHYEAQNYSSHVVAKESETLRAQLKALTEENRRLRNTENGDRSTLDDSDIASKNEDCIHLPVTEAMKKLQERFTKLMDDVANLSDDKQRLEHLVLQLQGETETIGEYIALYQKQRSFLKQREYEKDIRLNSLIKEREQIKRQIDLLNQSVRPFTQDDCEPANTDRDLVKKVIALIDEFGSAEIDRPNGAVGSLDGFQPCSWCSGKLIHV